MIARPPFKIIPASPSPLELEIEREVRFDEVDMVGIVWHGRYLSYLEEARVALGSRYKMGYADFYEHSTAVPLKKVEIDYKIPLRFQEKFKIHIMWHWSPAARLNMEYTIKNLHGEIVMQAYTVQLFVDSGGSHLVYPPDFYSEFLEHWKNGTLKPRSDV